MKDEFISSIGIYGRRHYEHLKRTHVTSVNVMRMNGTLEDLWYGNITPFEQYLDGKV